MFSRPFKDVIRGFEKYGYALIALFREYRYFKHRTDQAAPRWSVAVVDGFVDAETCQMLTDYFGPEFWN